MRFGCRIGLNTEGYAFPVAFHGRRFMRGSIIFMMAVPRFIPFDLGREPDNSLHTNRHSLFGLQPAWRMK
jgi:hypothetical protein